MKKSSLINNILNKINPWNIVLFTQEIKNAFGLKLTLMLSSVYYGLKGFIYSGAYLSVLPYSKALELTPQEYQLVGSLGLLPWSIKGFLGVLSDIFPLFGHHKTYYMLISCILSTAALCALVFMPLSIVSQHYLLSALLLFMVHFSPSICDLLCEGKYVEQMKKKPETKASIVLYVWWCQISAGLLASIWVGFVADHLEAQYLFIIYIPVAIQPIIFLASGCMIEDKVPRDRSNKIDREKVKQQGNYLIIAIFTALGAMGTFITAILFNSLGQLIYALVISGTMALLCFLFMPSTIAKSNTYMFLTFILYVNVTGALDYFYTADDKCLPNGPHFNNVFYRTYTSLVSDVFSLLGLFLYNTFIVKLKFRNAFWITTCIRVAASVIDIIIVKRWNIAVGINDHVIYMIGNAMVYKLVYMMDFLPGTLLTAKLCPKHVESTVYAILAGFANFGQTSSALLGVYLTDIFGIEGQPDPKTGLCNFENLSWLVLLSHCILPLTAIPLTFFLIPDAHVDSDILIEEPAGIPKHNG